jgi:hypothetical protein
MDLRQAREVARCASGRVRLAVVQQAEDHVVFDAGQLIVKCGTRDDFGVEASACERARSLGVPGPEVVSISMAAPIPHLALRKVPGVPPPLLRPPSLIDQLPPPGLRGLGVPVMISWRSSAEAPVDIVDAGRACAHLAV